MTLIGILKNITPKFIKRFIKSQIKNDLPKNFYCPVCSTPVNSFKRIHDSYLKEKYDTGYIHSLFLTETFNMLEYFCPECSTTDRSRLYALFLKEKFSNINQPVSLLHFAPERNLSIYVKNYNKINYRTTDLYMETVDDKIDMTDMNIYEDEKFNIFICSHVLEHIPDDIKALNELYRILKKGGWGILMVPINHGLQKIYENSEITSEVERSKHFGQSDHVRIYSKQGFLDRVTSVGFKVKEYDINYFGKETFIRHGINNRAVLYIVEK